jgi:PRTRC genetic system protein E
MTVKKKINMETNFFTQVCALPRAGAWKMTINFDGEQGLLVSVLFEGGDAALAPLIFKGTAAELDSGFFGAIAAPAEHTAKLFVELQAHLESLEKAKADLKAKAESKSASASPTKPKTDDKAEKKKRYDEIIAKAKELNGQLKYADALALLPTNEEFPDKAAELDGLRKVLTERNSQLTLMQTT